jgi:transcriptional regulator with XRE-family HTH domain
VLPLKPEVWPVFETQEIDPRLVGRRLAEARKACGRTQEEAAAFLGCSRPTLIAVEKGDRLPKAEEVIKLAGFYGRTVHEIVRPTAPAVPLEPHLRAVVDAPPDTAKELYAAIVELARFAEDYRALELLLESPAKTSHPPEVTLPKRDGMIPDFAEDAALRERDRLGLGLQPVLDLRELLETDVGVEYSTDGCRPRSQGCMRSLRNWATAFT